MFSLLYRLGFEKAAVWLAYVVVRFSRSERKEAALHYLQSGGTGVPACESCELPMLRNDNGLHPFCRYISGEAGSKYPISWWAHDRIADLSVRLSDRFNDTWG